MNEDQKAKQQLWDGRASRVNRKHYAPPPMPVLHPRILAKLNTLPPIKRMRFLNTLHGIETLYPIGKEREILLATLAEKLFITDDKQSGVSPEDASKEEAERSV